MLRGPGRRRRPPARHPAAASRRGHGRRSRSRSFDAFRLNGSNEVYGYEECGSGVKLVCKFFGGRFGWDRKRAAWTADREYHSYKELRRYALVGSPAPRDPAAGARTRDQLRARARVLRRRAAQPGHRRRRPRGDDERLYDPAHSARLLPRHPAQPHGQRRARRLRPTTAPTSTPSSPPCAGSAGSGRGTRTSSAGCRACGGCAIGCGPTSRCGCTATPRPRTSSSAAAWTSARSTWSG